MTGCALPPGPPPRFPEPTKNVAHKCCLRSANDTSSWRHYESDECKSSTASRMNDSPLVTGDAIVAGRGERMAFRWTSAFPQTVAARQGTTGIELFVLA